MQTGEVISTRLNHHSGDRPEANRTRKLRQQGSSFTSRQFVANRIHPLERNLIFFTFPLQHADVNWLLVVDIRSPNDVPIACI